MSGKRPPSTPLRDIARESLAEPPARAALDRLPPLGSESVAFDLAGLSVVIEGLDPDLADAVGRRFRAYACGPAGAISPLRVSAHADPIEYYVRPDLGERPEGYYRLRIVHEDGLIRLVAYSMAAWLDVEGRRGAIAFGTGDFDPRERAMENLVRVAVAWTAVSRGGFLLHGASIVRDGRGYIFFGKSASGKSTLCSLSTEGSVVSDDLSLVLPSAGGLVVAGTPFRGTFGAGDPKVGAWPLAGMFRLIQDDTTHVEEMPRVLAFAEYVANLPFVNDALHAYPGLMERLEAAVRGVTIRSLHFTKSPDFWKAVDASLDGSA
jgi:hypothetical protein